MEWQKSDGYFDKVSRIVGKFDEDSLRDLRAPALTTLLRRHGLSVEPREVLISLERQTQIRSLALCTKGDKNRLAAMLHIMRIAPSQFDNDPDEVPLLSNSCEITSAGVDASPREFSYKWFKRWREAERTLGFLLEHPDTPKAINLQLRAMVDPEGNVRWDAD